MGKAVFLPASAVPLAESRLTLKFLRVVILHNFNPRLHPTQRDIVRARCRPSCAPFSTSPFGRSLPRIRFHAFTLRSTGAPLDDDYPRSI